MKLTEKMPSFAISRGLKTFILSNFRSDKKEENFQKHELGTPKQDVVLWQLLV